MGERVVERMVAVIRREWERGRGAEDIAHDLGGTTTAFDVAHVLDDLGFDPFDKDGYFRPSAVS